MDAATITKKAAEAGIKNPEDVVAFTLGFVSARNSSTLSSSKTAAYSIGDQVARFEHNKKLNNPRWLQIDTFYEAAELKGKRVLVTGANRGLGLALTQTLIAAGAQTIALTRKPFTMDGLAQNISGVDVTSDKAMEIMQTELAKTGPVDIIINNAGYFYGPVERVTGDKLNFSEQLKMIDICALGCLRVVNALFNAKPKQLMTPGCKIVLITSQAGSITWRAHQNPHGDNYGHHMSRSCTNMMGHLLAGEMKEHGFPVVLLHPGFNRTEMTSKYAEIWDKEGAVDPKIGAKRVLHEVNRLSVDTTHGQYINCEDGLMIPW